MNNFMHRVSLGLENYKQRLGDLGIDAKTILANLTKLDKNDFGIEKKIENLIAEVTRGTVLSKDILADHQQTGKTLQEQYNSLKVDTLNVFESLTNIRMMNGTMINLFESLEFSQDKWFQELNKTSQRVILNQASIMDLHKNTIEKLDKYFGRLKKGKAQKIKPDHVERVIRKLEAKAEVLRAELAETEKESKRDRLQQKLEMVRVQQDRARWLQKEISE